MGAPPNFGAQLSFILLRIFLILQTSRQRERERETERENERVNQRIFSLIAAGTYHYQSSSALRCSSHLKKYIYISTDVALCLNKENFGSYRMFRKNCVFPPEFSTFCHFPFASWLTLSANLSSELMFINQRVKKVEGSSRLLQEMLHRLRK